MTTKEPSSETTVAAAGMRAARRLRRNSPVTSTTSATAMSRVSSTSCTEARMVRVRSLATLKEMSGGSWARSCGSSA